MREKHYIIHFDVQSGFHGELRISDVTTHFINKSRLCDYNKECFSTNISLNTLSQTCRKLYKCIITDFTLTYYYCILTNTYSSYGYNMF